MIFPHDTLAEQLLGRQRLSSLAAKMRGKAFV